MSALHKSLSPIDLSAYNICEDNFSDAASKRLVLMIKWFSKVSIADLLLLASSTLLSSIGELLISQEIIESKKVKEFQSLLKSHGVKYAEETILCTNTSNISAQILCYWKISNEIIDIIEYSDKPEEAPLEIVHLCVANNIINTLVSLKGEVEVKIPSILFPLMKENSLDTQPLEAALNAINK